MLPLNTKLPAFSLPDLDGKSVSSEQFANAPGVLVAFICTHCPYVKHIKTGVSRGLRVNIGPKGSR
jgi:peroxiredoxin